jgi:putative transposase
VSTLVRLSTERVWQEAWAEEQAAAVGRGRDERRASARGERNGNENGTLKTAEGGMRVEVPQIRGREEPYRSPLWSQVANPSDGLKRLLVERYAGGLSQRDIECGLAKAVGQFGLSKSAVSELTDPLSPEYEAFRTRDLSGYAVAYLFLDAVYEPVRRWGSKTGGFWVWAIGEDGGAKCC